MDHVAALELGYSRAQNLARTVKNKIGWCARQHKTASFSAYRASCRIAAATTMLAGASITSDTNVDVLVKLVVAPPTAAAAASIERIVADQPMRAVKGP